MTAPISNGPTTTRLHHYAGHYWQYTRTEGVHCLRIGCSAPNHKNKRGIGETTADTHKAG